MSLHFNGGGVGKRKMLPSSRRWTKKEDLISKNPDRYFGSAYGAQRRGNSRVSCCERPSIGGVLQHCQLPGQVKISQARRMSYSKTWMQRIFSNPTTASLGTKRPNWIPNTMLVRSVFEKRPLFRPIALDSENSER